MWCGGALGAAGEEKRRTVSKLLPRLHRLGRLLIHQLPEQPYPSDHPWALRKDPSRPRG